MITLSQAFRLLDLNDEGVYIRLPWQNERHASWFWGENVRRFFDMKRVRVVRIRRHFSYDWDEKEYELVVTGITATKLEQLRRKAERTF